MGRWVVVGGLDNLLGFVILLIRYQPAIYLYAVLA